MTKIADFDRAARAALSNDTLSYREVKGLMKKASAAVEHSSAPGRTAAALFERFDDWARNKYVGDERALRSIANAVEELSDDRKTFTTLGIRTLKGSGGRASSSRTSGGEGSPGRARGGESSGSTSRASGGEYSRPSSRTSGGEHGGSTSRASGGESGGSRRSSSGPSYTPRWSGGE